jgi:hypothetical protein
LRSAQAWYSRHCAAAGPTRRARRQPWSRTNQAIVGSTCRRLAGNARPGGVWLNAGAARRYA